MPGGDRTGPLGAGPMTGRGAGYCGGYDAPGYANPGTRLGLRRGFRGGGHGWRQRYYATGLPRWARGGYTPWTPEQESVALKTYAERLQSQLDAINKHIEEIKQKR
jgi:hypothetical protein